MHEAGKLRPRDEWGMKDSQSMTSTLETITYPLFMLKQEFLTPSS